jgi:hypothetical protein
MIPNIYCLDTGIDLPTLLQNVFNREFVVISDYDSYRCCSDFKYISCSSCVGGGAACDLNHNSIAGLLNISSNRLKGISSKPTLHEKKVVLQKLRLCRKVVQMLEGGWKCKNTPSLIHYVRHNEAESHCPICLCQCRSNTYVCKLSCCSNFLCWICCITLIEQDLHKTMFVCPLCKHGNLFGFFNQ